MGNNEIKKVKITFSNNYGKSNNVNNKLQKEIIIFGDCTITNYGKNETPAGAGFVTIHAKNGKSEIINGSSTKDPDRIVDFNNDKYSIFLNIAKQSTTDKANELTLNDLCAVKKLSEKERKKLGIGDVKFDKEAGVASIETLESGGKRGVLRIDFKTETESVNKNTTSTKTKPQVNKTTVKKQNNRKNVTTNNSISNVISHFNGGNCPIEKVKDLDTVAKYTGISKSYIKNVLVGIEGKKNLPILKAEYDGVPTKNNKKGQLTIGFGHTNLTGEPIINESTRITEKQAYQILANDIITARKYAKHYLNIEENGKKRNLYDEAPKSIQDALIDLAFNKGPGEVKNISLKENLKRKNYAATARRTWYNTNCTGLQKRNLYRFIEALKDIKKSDIEKAMKRFKDEHLYDLIQVFKTDSTAEKAWDNACVRYRCPANKF